MTIVDKPGGLDRPLRKTAARYYEEQRVAPEVDADRHFQRSERRTAERLRVLGFRVLSIDDTSELPDADALVDGLPVEIKSTSVGTENAVYKQIRRAALKTDRVVLDASGTPLDLTTATRAVANVVRVSGRSLREILIFMGSGDAVSWGRDE
ncbi:hypothetical protein ABLE92_25265 [Gordonia sp. VNQ95]|uniref:CdiA C-terminal domain-containing protein n=1 Tax=Gordonia TaxID=2053 RepID=UPI0032B5A898